MMDILSTVFNLIILAIMIVMGVLVFRGLWAILKNVFGLLWIPILWIKRLFIK